MDLILLKFDGQCLKMDESSVTGESDLIEKCLLSHVQQGVSGSEEANPNDRYCLMISGSTVNEGTA